MRITGLLLCLLLPITGLANETETVSDPFEGINRGIWDFNYEFLDKQIYKPTAEAYVDYISPGAREALNNFVLNFEEPSSAVNHLLQLEVKESLSSVMRFVVNSTFGLVGFIDVAGKTGLTRNRAEFQDVLGSMGVGHGPYVMVPVFGPKTTRKLAGDIVDTLYFPFSSLTYFERLAHWGMDGIYNRAEALGQDALIDQSLDPYIFVRDAYVQYQDYRVNPSVSEPEEDDGALEDYLDEIEE